MGVEYENCYVFELLRYPVERPTEHRVCQGPVRIVCASSVMREQSNSVLTGGLTHARCTLLDRAELRQYGMSEAPHLPAQSSSKARGYRGTASRVKACSRLFATPARGDLEVTDNTESRYDGSISLALIRYAFSTLNILMSSKRRL